MSIIQKSKEIASSPAFLSFTFGFLATIVRSWFRAWQPLQELPFLLLPFFTAFLILLVFVAISYFAKHKFHAPSIFASPACTIWLFAVLPPRSSDFWSNGGTEDMVIYALFGVIDAFLVLPLALASNKPSGYQFFIMSAVLTLNLIAIPFVVGGVGSESFNVRAIKLSVASTIVTIAFAFLWRRQALARSSN